MIFHMISGVETSTNKDKVEKWNDDDFVDDVNRSLWSKLCLINEAHLASRVTKPGNLKCKKSTLGLIAEHLTNLVLIILDKPENLRLQRLSPIFTWRTKKQFFSHVYNVLCCSIIGKTIIAARLTIDKMGLFRSTSHLFWYSGKGTDMGRCGLLIFWIFADTAHRQIGQNLHKIIIFHNLLEASVKQW